MQNALKTIKGIIIPDMWDSKGTVTGIKIMGYDEDQFEIADNTAGKALFAHLRQPVTVTGDLTVIQNKKQIRVENFILHNDQPA